MASNRSEKFFLVPGMIRYVRKLRRMMRWAREHNDPQMYWFAREANLVWTKRLRRVLNLEK